MGPDEDAAPPQRMPAEQTAEYLVYRRGAGVLEPHEVRILADACRTLLSERERIRVALAGVRRGWADVRYEMNALTGIFAPYTPPSTMSLTAVRSLPDGRMLAINRGSQGAEWLYELGADGQVLRSWLARDTTLQVLRTWDGSGEPPG
jgi:hypothetical protein